jgi:hypothetical protein
VYNYKNLIIGGEMIQALIGAWLALLAAAFQTGGGADKKGYKHIVLWLFAGFSIFGFFACYFFQMLRIANCQRKN